MLNPHSPAHVQAVNTKLSHWEQIRRWRAIAESPTVEHEELTPTLKLRRHVVCRRWAPLIESMYQDAAGAAPAELPAATPLVPKGQP